MGGLAVLVENLLDVAARGPGADGAWADGDAELGEDGGEFAWRAGRVARGEVYFGGSPDDPCHPRVAALLAFRFLCVAWRVDAGVADWAYAVQDARGSGVGDDVAQPRGGLVQLVRVDGACAACPQVGFFADGAGQEAQVGRWRGGQADADAPRVEDRFEVVVVAVEGVPECFAHWCGRGGAWAAASPVAGRVAVCAVEPVVFEVVEVGCEPCEVLCGLGLAWFAHGGGLGVVADGARQIGVVLSSLIVPVRSLTGVLSGFHTIQDILLGCACVRRF